MLTLKVFAIILLAGIATNCRINLEINRFYYEIHSNVFSASWCALNAKKSIFKLVLYMSRTHIL